MNCQEFMEFLNHAIDEDLPEDIQQDFDEHSLKCPTCQSEHQIMMGLLSEVGDISMDIQPERDLWPEIEERLTIPPKTIVDFPNIRKQVVGIALLAALLLFIVSVGIKAPSVTITPQNTVAQSEHEKIKTDYKEAKDSLLAALELQKANFSPQTLDTIEENLAVIENAVIDIDRALAANPDNKNLERKLYAAYQTEVSLLQSAVQLNENN